MIFKTKKINSQSGGGSSSGSCCDGNKQLIFTELLIFARHCSKS